MVQDLKANEYDHPLAVALKECRQLENQVFEFKINDERTMGDMANNPSHQQILLLYKAFENIESEIQTMNNIVNIYFGKGYNSRNGEYEYEL